jgi:hypothetical protein
VANISKKIKPKVTVSQLAGVKTYKTLSEAFSSINKELEQAHIKFLKKYPKGRK